MYGTKRSRAQAGFTLVELMIVVAILGILSAIGLPAYKSYINKSKTAEAVGFLAEIKARQESYRADFGMYCGVSANATAWTPDNNPGERRRAWLHDASWRQLGAFPPGGEVLFSYVSVAGLPGTLPGTRGFGSDLGYDGTDFWFVSRALGDIDGDDVNVIFESYSHGQGIHIDREGGWE